MAMQQGVVNTLPQGRGPQTLSQQDSWWVAGFMFAGIAGLLVIYLIFRKNVEL